LTAVVLGHFWLLSRWGKSIPCTRSPNTPPPSCFSPLKSVPLSLNAYTLQETTPFSSMTYLLVRNRFVPNWWFTYHGLTGRPIGAGSFGQVLAGRVIVVRRSAWRKTQESWENLIKIWTLMAQEATDAAVVVRLELEGIVKDRKTIALCRKELEELPPVLAKDLPELVQMLWRDFSGRPLKGRSFPVDSSLAEYLSEPVRDRMVEAALREPLGLGQDYKSRLQQVNTERLELIESGIHDDGQEQHRYARLIYGARTIEKFIDFVLEIYGEHIPNYHATPQRTSIGWIKADHDIDLIIGLDHLKEGAPTGIPRRPLDELYVAHPAALYLGVVPPGR